MAAVDTNRPGSQYPQPGDKVAGQSNAHAYAVTPSLDPDMIKKGVEGFEEHAGYLQCAVDAFSVAHVGLQKIAEARKQAGKNSAWREEQQILIVAGEAQKMQDRMLRSMDNARKTLTQGIAHTDAELSKPLEVAADTTLSAEMRTFIRSLKTEERNKVLSEALADNDSRVLYAALGCHHLLSGISKVEQQTWTRRFHEKAQPQVASRLAAMKRGLEMVERSAPLVLIETEKALGASWDKVSRLKSASTAAEAALALLRGDMV